MTSLNSTLLVSRVIQEMQRRNREWIVCECCFFSATQNKRAITPLMKITNWRVDNNMATKLFRPKITSRDKCQMTSQMSSFSKLLDNIGTSDRFSHNVVRSSRQQLQQRQRQHRQQQQQQKLRAAVESQALASLSRLRQRKNHCASFMNVIDDIQALKTESDDVVNDNNNRWHDNRIDTIAALITPLGENPGPLRIERPSVRSRTFDVTTRTTNRHPISYGHLLFYELRVTNQPTRKCNTCW